MPSKLKKAIAAMKDHTSIGLARVGGYESSTLEVAILKATTHEDEPVDERHVAEVLQLVSSNRSYAGCCARAIGRRVGRTRSWVVVLKSLMLVLRIFQDGDPHFPKEVVQAMRRGYKILNLSSFRDDSGSDHHWDFTAFVRSFAVFLDERLDCFLTGKLQQWRRKVYGGGGGGSHRYWRKETALRDMKPGALLDRVSHWQRLLDRAIETRPTGVARKNRLVQTCLYAIVRETFELYRDIYDGLALVLDCFFHLQYNNCINAYNTCIKASKQFEELSSFYDLCRDIGVGRSSEYPSVHRVSEELMDTLHEFLKDQSSFPSGAHGRIPTVRESESRSRPECGGSSQCMSLEELMSADPCFTPERYSDPGGEKSSHMMGEYYYGVNDAGSVKSDPVYCRGVTSVLDLFSLEDPPLQPEVERQGQEKTSWESKKEEPNTSSASAHGWELVVFETTSQPSNSDQNRDELGNNKGGFEFDLFKNITSSNENAITPSPWLSSEQNYNPFLQDTVDLAPSTLYRGPTFKGDHYLGYGDLNTIVNFSSGFPTEPTFAFEFGNGNVNQNRSFSGSFGHDPNHGRDVYKFSVLGLPSPGGYGAMVAPSTPTFSAGSWEDAYGDATRAIVPFGQVGLDNHDQDDPFGLFLGGEQRVNNSRSLATVPFGQVGADDHLSPHPTFQATPTFQTTGLETDRRASNIGQDDPFELAAIGQQSVSSGSLAMVPFGQVATNDQLSPRPTFQVVQPFRTKEIDQCDLNNEQSVPFKSFPMMDQRLDSGCLAMVPFGTDDLLSPSSTSSATPTFRAIGSEMDPNGLNNKQEDTFGSFPFSSMLPIRELRMGHGLYFDQQNVFDQQQLWLQKQNKIIARQFTSMDEPSTTRTTQALIFNT
ncbi:hypothetical protein Cgig2_032516 [Carnegiea gigantea]|uniref:ENTH domain-containing protein n=1 Tax=Carnegiea gigantea TaxID=171969 RepID=A0A9Q1KY20_9CARY|nr:hypothetical protein Cgig2_032516 [Carnegiea gigantea]